MNRWFLVYLLGAYLISVAYQRSMRHEYDRGFVDGVGERIHREIKREQGANLPSERDGKRSSYSPESWRLGTSENNAD